MRTLWYAPILHSAADMGEDFVDPMRKFIGPRFLPLVDRAWRRLQRRTARMASQGEIPCKGLLISADSFVIDFLEYGVDGIRKMDARGSVMLNIFRDFTARGAHFEGLEDPGLVALHTLIKWDRRGVHAEESILGQRDRFIAKRLVERVPDGGGAFIMAGVDHRIDDVLLETADDFTVRRINCFTFLARARQTALARVKRPL